ncbi:MAG: acetyl-CoA carboxylase biotin carboxyl carrier protein [Planctomycetota bacterium]|jgi:acetyl-CoA carboxylase biotin carboxyl carrier protein
MAIKRAKKKATKKVAKKAASKAKKKTTKKTTKKKTAKKPAAKSASKPKAGGWVGDVAHLLDMMMANDLSEIQIEDGPRKIVLRRGPSGEAVIAQNGQTVSAAPAPVASPAAAPAETPASVSDGLVEIVSPMVGTFYASPSPDSDPFVAVGANIGDETVICIVEAMKVMNEIKAECAGTIAEVCVRNAQPVEYGQVLFKVRPS